MKRVEKCIEAIMNGNLAESYKLITEIKESGNSEEIFTLAEELNSLGFLDEAANLYEKLLDDFPNEGELIISLAEIYVQLNRESEALLLLEKISPSDPTYLESLLIQADLYEAEGLFEVSEQKLLEAEKLAPHEPVIQFALAEIYASIGKYAESIYKYEQVQKVMAEIGDVNINQRLAEIYSTAGEFEKSLEFYERALDDKLDINTLFGYGFTAYRAGLHQTAIEKLTEVQQLDPDYESVYLPLAECLEHENQLDKALNIAISGLQVNPFQKELYYFVGKLQLKLDNKKDAEEHLRKALEIEPHYIEAILMLNKILQSEERFSELILLTEPLLINGEEDPYILWDFAIACQEEERYKDALTSYRKAYEFLRENESFLQNYGFFLLEEGIFEDAIEVFKQLQKIDPTNIDYLDVLERLEMNSDE